MATLSEGLRVAVRSIFGAGRGALGALSRDAGLREHGMASREACARVARTYDALWVAVASFVNAQVGKGWGAAEPLRGFGITRLPSAAPQQNAWHGCVTANL